MSKKQHPIQKEQEIVTFEDIERLTKLIFIPAGYIVQLKNLDNDIIWEDSQTVRLRGDKTGHKCYKVNFGRDTPCPHCTAFDSIATMIPQIKEDRSIIDGKWYRIIAIPVLFHKKIAAIELIQEITQEKLKNQIYDSVLSRESVLLNILRHDIPSYLHTVNIALEGLLSSEEEPQNKHLVEVARSNTNRAVKILQDLRELSRFELPYDNLRPVDAAEILNNVQKDVIGHFSEKDIQFNIHSELSSNKSNIIANDLLSEIFLNIFSNAIKFTPGTQVRINIRIDEFIEEQEYIRFQISDFGQGIPPEIKKSLFDRTSLIKSGWKPTKGSTGLGMTIIKSLIEFFGGEISYRNRIEDDWTKGTTIILYFPLATQNIVN